MLSDILIVRIHNMTLSHYTFIIKARGYSPEIHRTILSSEHFTTVIIGVSDLATAILVAKEQTQSGTQLVELCGGFTQLEASQVRHQLPTTVPVGVVVYTTDQEAELSRMFT